MDKIHQISATHLAIEQIGEIIKKGIRLELSEDARQRIIRCRTYLDKKIMEQQVSDRSVRFPSTKTVCLSYKKILSCPMPVVWATVFPTRL